MSDQSNVLFGVSAGATTSVNAQYPFKNEVKSSDGSVKVSSDGSSADLAVKISGGATVSALLKFTLKPEEYTHYLECASSGSGLVTVNNSSLGVLPPPESPAILIWTGSQLQWMQVPANADGAVLGVSGGSFTWFGISDCANACEEETQG